MFYSETLLSKTGPLARVWLAANIERKLTKQNVLQENLETRVNTIMDSGHGGQAPIALRLSGQLLLGVVRIYSRKARYLLDDCNEALMKIKLAFRPGNVDLPANQSHTANPATLVLPDTITELDLFAPMLDPDELLMRSTPAPGQDQDMLDWGTSQVLQASMDTRRPQDQTLELMEDDLGLDIGQDLASPQTIDRSIEVGRRAESARPDLRDESMLYHDDLGLDLGLDEPIFGQDDDIQMGGLEEFAQIEESNLTALARAEEREQRRRESASPLSSIGSEQERELEQTFQLEQAAQHEAEEDEAMVQAAQRVKRRRVLQADTNTELHNSQIKAQQEDRSRILRAPNFLPRDPLLLTLMQMQKNGGFVSSILGDGRSMGWAPELRGVLSLEVVRRTGELKRKRDSGIADIVIPEEEEELAAQGGAVQTPQLELEEEQQFELGPEPEMDLPPTFSPPPADVPLEEEGAMSPAPGFDETTIPLLHPAESGPVSLGTKHAVHLLREHFSSAAGLEANEPPSPGTRRQQSVQFTELCPEERTSRQDATKMFFEMLVLGTKDAIKVEQDPDVLGAPIRVRGKRGLWGDWAEMGAGGEIASQSQGGAVQATEIAV